jgi:hypothetical protein
VCSVIRRDCGLGRGLAEDLEKSPDLLRSALAFAKIDVLVLLHEGRKLSGVGSIAQYRDEAEAFTIVRVAHEAEANLAIDPGLDAKAADVHEHGRGTRDGFFESCLPGVAGLQMVLVEPDVEAVAAEDFRELASRLRVRAGVTEKDHTVPIAV